VTLGRTHKHMHAHCRNTFRLNTLLIVHKSFTYALSMGIRVALLWFGGVALFSGLTTIGAAVNQTACSWLHQCSITLMYDETSLLVKLVCMACSEDLLA